MAKAGNVLDLRAPQFIAQAEPNSTDSFIGDKLDAEAGISAYYKAPDTIDLNQVAPVFRTIEISTTEYIIGSVAVPNYPEHYDVHVYVNTNGWIFPITFERIMQARLLISTIKQSAQPISQPL